MLHKKSISEIKEFIEKLELAIPERKTLDLHLKGPTLKDGEKSGYVDDASLVSFVSGVSGEHQSDVLNSTLLAQLAATRKFSRWSETEDWFKFYVDVMGNIGWVIQNFEFTEATIEGATFIVQDVVIKLLGAIATQNELMVITETMDALKALSDDDGRLVLFDTQSQSLGKGSFQIAICSESGGNVATKIGSFHFASTETHTRFLWIDYSTSDCHFFKGSQEIVLNENIYKQIRQSVIDKLGDSAKTYIDNIEI